MIVISINGNSETHSDPQEVFLTPKSGPVTSVKILSFPNASVLLSWKPPKVLIDDKLDGYALRVEIEDSSIINEVTVLRIQETMFDKYGDITDDSHVETINGEEKLFDKPRYQLVPGVTYVFFIVPFTPTGPGYE
ncbi:hypothetical protein V9T40_012838 [Parthenolecanium corni]|uniref:Uncharacterized protein n=1 Tax=Parthenolecanium corni TaxID=536013 RepID=A0AAN9TL25_9HEMI